MKIWSAASCGEPNAGSVFMTNAKRNSALGGGRGIWGMEFPHRVQGRPLVRTSSARRETVGQNSQCGIFFFSPQSENIWFGGHSWGVDILMGLKSSGDERDCPL